MNTQFLPLLLLPYLALAAPTDVSFSTNFAETQARAIQEDKPYFVHFTAAWCMPCQWMEQHTFADDELSVFVHEHYFAVKMDFDDPTSAVYKKLYNVTSLPSLLIFNSKGELLDRYDASLSKDKLLSILQKYISTKQSRKTENTNAVAVKVAYSTDKISRPALIPEEVNTVAEMETAAPKSAEKLPEAHFAIQIGVYSDIANAERSRDRAAARFDQPLEIVLILQNDKKLYKVMLGKFEFREAAEAYLKQLGAQGVQGFVKKCE